mmetsp:Transcript_12077/g.18622  ORF Transcript_12077/g.18622 Transcript_12077/m.18622 type:complete len:746 (+) Transcript_12077:170-2407(+)
MMEQKILLPDPSSSIAEEEPSKMSPSSEQIVDDTTTSSRFETADAAVKVRERTWETMLRAYQQKVDLLRAKREEIQTGHENLARLKQEFATTTSNDGTTTTTNSNTNDDDWIDINAGGVPFRVRRSTLTQLKGTRLEALFSGRWDNYKVLRDSHGRIFLDVSPTCFQSILDYLSELKHVVSEYDNDNDNITDLQPYVLDEGDQLYLDYLMESFGLFEIEEGLVINSTILDEPEHIQELYNFLSEDQIDSRLDLLYRGSRDGFRAEDFHELCDGQGPTVTIIKDRTGNIFGGYLDKSWNSYEGWLGSENAFLFLLCSNSNNSSSQITTTTTHPVKMKIRDDSTGFAVYCAPDHGPTFGEFDMQIPDLCNVNRCASNIDTYQLPGQNNNNERILTNRTNFRVFEIEVHRVAVKKKDNSNNKSDEETNNNNNEEEEEEWNTATFDEFPDELKDAFLLEQTEITSLHKELQKLELAFEKEKAFVEYYFSSTNHISSSIDPAAEQNPDDEIITFLVSGTTLQTRRSTLAIMKESVLAKHFDDPLWKQQQQQSSLSSSDNTNKKLLHEGIKRWNSSQVSEWVTTTTGFLLEGVSPEEAATLNEQKMSGLELLALESEHLEKMGITRVATQALIMKNIQELKKKEEESDDDDDSYAAGDSQKSMIVEHSSYCFGKILDHLRYLAFYRSKEEEDTRELPVPLPVVRKSEQKRFQHMVEYYFPCETSSFISEIPFELSDLTIAMTKSIDDVRWS